MIDNMNSIDKSESTVFRCSLDENIDITKTNIYSITLLLAWREVQKILDTKDIIINNSRLSRLNMYHVTTIPLKEGEYEKNVIKKDINYTIEVSFKKLLPFAFPVIVNENPLDFDSKKVSSFSPKKYASVIYYQSEDDFAIKLIFNDEESEMVLVKTTFDEGKSLKDYLPNMEEDMPCYLYPDDIIEIPEIEFALESKFRQTFILMCCEAENLN